MTPNSDKVCKHLDNQLTDMEKRLEASLSASLSASITASVTAGLKGLIDDSLKTALETMTNTVNETIDKHPTIKQHGEQLDSLETENIILRDKVSLIEGENSKMKHRLASIESRALQHNIIIRGITEEDWEKESTTKSKAYTELAHLIPPEQTTNKELKEDEILALKLKAIKKKINIRSCKRIGRYVKDRSRPISVELLRSEDIDFILANKKELHSGIFADKEYPQDIENKRKILRPILTAAKNSKKYKKRCRMQDDVLVIKGKRYGIDDLDTLPKSLHPLNISSRSNSEVYGYFGEMHPLSNFFPAAFTLENKTFHCSEQFIQWKKAELFKDHTAMSKIERCKTGRQCKEEGRKVKNFKKDTWDSKAKNLCQPGIRQKYIENKKPREILLQKTKGKKIVECTKDAIWGCGLPLKDDNCLDSTMWTTQGIMGITLGEIRSELSTIGSLSQTTQSKGGLEPASSESSDSSDDSQDETSMQH